MNNFDFLYSLFNPFVYQQAKSCITDLEYYFQTNPATVANPLVDELIKAIKTYDYDTIGEPLFRSILERLKKTPEESNKIMSDVKKWVTYSKDQVQPTIKYLSDVCASVVIQKANRLHGNSPSEYIKYLKNYNFQSLDLEIFSSTKFNDVDINSILAENSKGAVGTNIGWLNRAFEPHNGLERGQLGIICSEPGTGKSMMSMNLALWMASHGEKVIYYCLGDMNMRDFIVRMGTIALGISFAEAYTKLYEVYKAISKMVGSNLEISINPAGVVEADDIVNKTLDGDYTVAIIDYDGNLAGVSEGDSMYNTFGEIYNKFTKMTLAGKLVLVDAQPKVTSWGKMIELQDIGESSRKQHAADFIITMSNVNTDCPNHLYVQKLVKARRGKVGSKAYVIRVEGRFIEIPKGLYDQLRQVTEEKNYTEAEIITMIHQFNANYSQIQKEVEKKIKQYDNPAPQPKNIVNPFVGMNK